MIALPGLTLVAGPLRHRPPDPRSLRPTRSVDHGLLPNRFPDAGETPRIQHCRRHALVLRGHPRLPALQRRRKNRAPAGSIPYSKTSLTGTCAAHATGIHVDADGLLACGESGVQLDMDGRESRRLRRHPATGKPVEIQALWYNALCIMEGFGRRFGDPSSEALSAGLAVEASASFNKRFWNESAGCLYDVVENGHADGSLRPNQIFAVSLPHGMLPPEKARSIVETVQTELLTPLERCVRSRVTTPLSCAL